MKRLILLVMVVLLLSTSCIYIGTNPNQPQPQGSNQPPTAYIDAITPANPTTADIIIMEGHGTDVDGTIAGYKWSSDIDGNLGAQSTIQAKLSAGNHIIYFQVQDNGGSWSGEVRRSITVTGLSAISPVINSFTAVPDTISVGGSSMLSWNVSNATSISIDNGIGAVPASGHVLVSPMATTNYTLTASNTSGSVYQSVLVNVSGIIPIGIPNIISFTANPDIIFSGASSTLSWQVTNASSITIDNGIGAVNATGSINVSPGSTTSYQMTAVNGVGMMTKTVTVTVKFILLPPLSVIETVTLYSVAAEDGHVNQDGGINPYPNVGDSSANKALQAFLSFDISAIPSDAEITDVSLYLNTGDVLGDPFAGLGWMRVYNDQYGNLGPEDFTVDWPTGALYTFSSKPVSAITSSTLKSQLQSRVTGGASRFQLRLQFESYTDGDNASDALRLGEGQPKLVITYKT